VVDGLTTADTFDFAKGDDRALRRGSRMKVRGHCLVRDHNNPKWLAEANSAPLASHPARAHHTVMKHYSGRVFAWDVVNEALDENGTAKD
jgi:endo-1,4-beta-xylanase